MYSFIMLISLGRNKATTTTFEPNLKQPLSNTGQGDGHWPGPYLEFSENGTRLQLTGNSKGRTYKAMHFPPLSNKG